MTVLGENPGEQYFDVRTITGTDDVQTHVGYIKGIGMSGSADVTGVIGSTPSIVDVGGTIAAETPAYLVVGGW